MNESLYPATCDSLAVSIDSQTNWSQLPVIRVVLIVAANDKTECCLQYCCTSTRLETVDDEIRMF